MTGLLTPTVFHDETILDYVKMTASQATGIPVRSGAQPSGIPTSFMPFAHLHTLLPSLGSQAKGGGDTRERRGQPPVSAWRSLGKKAPLLRQNPAQSSHCLRNTNRTGSQGEGFLNNIFAFMQAPCDTSS